MNELMLFEKHDKAVVSSRVIAERFSKRHHDVMLAINGKIKNLTTEKFVVTNYFIESKYTHNGNIYKEYLLTRDGFCFIVMGFNGKQADLWKLKYIDAFNHMEAYIRERQTTEWLQTRKQGKLTRRNETDSIQKLIPYAVEQGSKNSHMFYTNYSKLVNKTAGIESGQREFASHKDLMVVAMIEDMICKTIDEEIQKGTYYKEIYKKCKAKAEQFAMLTYLTA